MNGEVQISGDVPHGERVTISRSAGGRMGPNNDIVNKKSVLPLGIESRFSGCRSDDLVYGELVVNPRCLGWLQCSSVYRNL